MAANRRQFLLGASGVAALAVGTAIASDRTILASTQAECADIHARLAQTYREMSRSAEFAAGNVLTAVADIACPCCGAPLFDFLS